MTEKRIADIFKGFCDENRIKIIRFLKDGEKCACKLLENLNITQPTLSHHMKILVDGGWFLPERKESGLITLCVKRVLKKQVVL